jgi:hypothetical protein
MDAPDGVFLPANVPPGQSIDISVNMVAPAVPGTYQGFWKLQSPDGQIFGFGGLADKTIWVKIRAIAPAVDTPTSTVTVPPPATISAGTPTMNVTYDFVDRACAAQWEGNDGILPCPGLDVDVHGFVVPLARARLEDGTDAPLPALLTVPQFSGSGYIQGAYPAYQVQIGDHLQTTVSCEDNATSCSVLFRISYQDSSGAIVDLWTFGEFYDGKYFNLDLDLAPLAGRQVSFILKVSSLGSPVEDRALWVAPRIVRFPPATPTATATAAASATASSTVTPAPTVAATHTPTPVPTPVPPAQGPFPSLSQIIENIIAFFKQLFGK